MMNYKAYVAEAIGTFWLTFGGCGSAGRLDTSKGDGTKLK